MPAWRSPYASRLSLFNLAGAPTTQWIGIATGPPHRLSHRLLLHESSTAVAHGAAAQALGRARHLWLGTRGSARFRELPAAIERAGSDLATLNADMNCYIVCGALL